MFLLSGAALTIVALVAFIIIIGLIISLHELGHLVAAKKAGVMCYDYSIGFGPLIYKKDFGETQFSVRAIPVGGFVQMAGVISFDEDIKKEESIGLNLDSEGRIIEIVLDPQKDSDVRGKVIDLDLVGEDGNPQFITLDLGNGDEMQYEVASENASYVFEKNQRLKLAPYNRTLDSKKKPWRLIVLAAGSLMNFILALFIYLIVSFASGVANTSSNEIGSVTKDFPAAEVLLAGDEITSVNGVKTASWTEFSNEMDKAYNNYQTTVTLSVLRDGNEINDIKMEALTGFNSIGISNFGSENYKLSLIPNTDVYGLEIGQVYSRYKKSGDEDYELNIADGDYLVGISIDGVEYMLNENVDVDGYGTLTGWGYLCYLVDTKIGTGAPDVLYSYYHLDEGNEDDTSDDKYSLVSFSEAKVIDPYTDEVLNSQNVDKILHYIGVSCTTHFDFFPCIGQAFKMFGSDFTMIFKTLKVLLFPSDVRQVGISNLSGVVGIFGQIKSYINAGIIPLLAFAAMLSVNIGIVNLLPIPALDGGKILFVIIEAITGKRIPKKVETIINLVFMALLLILMVYVTFNDIARL